MTRPNPLGQRERMRFICFCCANPLPISCWQAPARSAQSNHMRSRRLIPLLWLALLIGLAFITRAASPYDKIIVETSSTSIYIGRVTLSVAPLVRQSGIYSGDYKAKVFPYFFMSEHGTFRMEVSDDDLARVVRGETVEFKGEAENNGHEARKITGRATPDDAVRGKIKVRIFVTEKIQLIFNTSYRFEN